MHPLNTPSLHLISVLKVRTLFFLSTNQEEFPKVEISSNKVFLLKVLKITSCEDNKFLQIVLVSLFSPSQGNLPHDGGLQEILTLNFWGSLGDWLLQLNQNSGDQSLRHFRTLRVLIWTAAETKEQEQLATDGPWGGEGGTNRINSIYFSNLIY